MKKNLNNNLLSEKKICLALLFAICGAMLWVCLPLFNSSEVPIGGDAQTHIAAIARLAKAMENGSGWWNPDYYAGFPTGLYYQPLPHTITALSAICMGGHEYSTLAYKLWLIVLLVLYPLAFYYSVRLLKFSHLEALCSVIIVLTIHNYTPSGIDENIFGKFAGSIQPILRVGLYTQAWANIFFLLTIATSYNVLNGDKHLYKWAITLLSLLFLSHLFYGIAAVLLLFIIPLSQSKWPYESKWKYLLWIAIIPYVVVSSYFVVPEIPIVLLILALIFIMPDLKTRYFRLMLIYVPCLLILLFWFLPLSLSFYYMGGYPLESDIPFKGIGISNVCNSWLQGYLFDAGRNGELFANIFTKSIVDLRDIYENTNGIPIIGILVFAGILLSVTKIHNKKYLSLLCLFTVCFFCLCGETSFGETAYLYRVNKYLPLYRYSSLLIIFCAVFAGLFCAFAMRKNKFLLVSLSFLLALLFFTTIIFSRFQAHTMDYEANLVGDSKIYKDAIESKEFLAQLPGNERVMILPYKNYLGGILSFHTGKPLINSRGVGAHDSSNYYFVESLIYNTAYWESFCDIYNIRYIVASKIENIGSVKEIWSSSNNHFRIYEVNEKSSYFSLGNVKNAHKSGDETISWIKGNSNFLHRFSYIEGKKNYVPHEDLYPENYTLPIIIPNDNQRILSSKKKRNIISFEVEMQKSESINIYIPSQIADSKIWEISYMFQGNNKVMRKEHINQEITITLSQGNHIIQISPVIEGEILQQKVDIDKGIYTAEVECKQELVVVLKNTFHPFWKAIINDQQQPIHHVSPSFIAIKLQPGTHEISLSYEQPLYIKILFICSLLFIFSLFIVDKIYVSKQSS